MLKVGFITTNLGSTSEVWMYRQLTGFSKLSASVLTWNYFNQTEYPYTDVSLINDLRKPFHSNKFIRFIQKRLRFLLSLQYQQSKAWPEIQYWIKAKRPDILLCQFGTVGVEVLPIAKKVNIPIVCHFHGQDLSSILNTNSKYNNKLKKYLTCFDEVIVVGRHQKEWLLKHGMPDRKIHLIPCGVPVNEFTPMTKENNEVKFLTVSRLVEKKGIEYTIKSFELVRKHINCSLTLIGDGPLKDKITSLINSSDFSHDIKMLGNLSQALVKEQLNNADIFLQHSITANDGDTEGSPVAIAEASASGLPVISTLHAGIPELIKNNISGFLVEEQDYHKMAKKMLVLAKDKTMRDKMGQAGREHMLKYFNTPKQVSKLENVLLKATKNKLSEKL